MFTVAAILWCLPLTVRGDYVAVNFSSQANFTWAAPDTVPNEPTATRLPGAPTGAVTLGGIPFNITSNASGKQAWHADVAANGGTGTQTLMINVNIACATDVYTLVNTWDGAPGPNSYAALVFTGTGGATYTKDLIGAYDIRDYNNANWTNSSE